MYSCPIDAEPLHRYKRGGYHPTQLGALLSNGRYKILHKLGWGGYSTVWAARDQKEGTYVAVKICVSEEDGDRVQRELIVLKELGKHAHSQHVMRLLDDFDIQGPNGSHSCLVLELSGPSVSDIVENRCSDDRLRGGMAKDIAKQALVGLNCLHQHKIAHGDLHTRNLAFALDPIDDMPEDDFVKRLGTPEIGNVSSHNGRDLPPGIPKYLVRPATLRSWPLSKMIKIIDFGESFLPQSAPRTLHTPLPVRAPEVIFGDTLDHRVDLWSLGCLIFELFTGQPPFDSFFINPKILVDQMREFADDPLPQRWVGQWKEMKSKIPSDDSNITLQEWLEEIYFDDGRKADLTKEDIVQIGRIVRKLLWFEPAARASAREILDEPWFRT